MARRTTANTRVFNVTLPGEADEAVGGEQRPGRARGFVSEVILAPSERAVDVCSRSGQLELQHRTPDRTYRLGRDHGDRRPAATPSLAEEFQVRGPPRAGRLGPVLLEPGLEALPDKTLALIAEMDDIIAPGQGPVMNAAAHHPEVTNAEPGRAASAG